MKEDRFFPMISEQLTMADSGGRLPVICANLREPLEAVIKGTKVYIADPHSDPVQILARTVGGSLVVRKTSATILGSLRIEMVHAAVVFRCWRDIAETMREVLDDLSRRCAPKVMDFSAGVDLSEIVGRSPGIGSVPRDR